MRDVKGFERLIYAQAHKFKFLFLGKRGWTPKETFEELVSDGKEIFVKLCREEEKKPLTCDFALALATKINQRFINELQGFSRLKRGGKDIPIETLSSKNIEEGMFFDPRKWFDKYFDLSEEVRTVVDIIVRTPEEFQELREHFGVKKSISKYLQQNLGWSVKQTKNLWARLPKTA